MHQKEREKKEKKKKKRKAWSWVMRGNIVSKHIDIGKDQVITIQ
jgi:hypothetical protein